MGKSLIVNSNNINGVCYNSQNYPLTKNAQVTASGTLQCTKTITGTSTGAKTSGYKCNFRIVDTQFKLYKNLDFEHPLSSVPSGYKFVYINADQRVVLSTMTLVYDGNELFHISGYMPTDYSFYYSTGKNGTTEAGIFLLDENDVLYYSRVGAPLGNDGGTATSTSVNFNASSLTYGRQDVNFTYIYNVELPLRISGTAYKRFQPYGSTGLTGDRDDVEKPSPISTVRTGIVIGNTENTSTIITY